MAVRVRAQMRLTQWNGARIAARVPVIVERYGRALDVQLRQEITTIQYPWPRVTRRRNGQTVSSPRDIVDLGGFLRSQRLEAPSPTRRRFVWDARSPGGFPYAPLIFTGYTTSRGAIVPGRDWMTPALQNLPPARFFAQEWSRLGR